MNNLRKSQGSRGQEFKNYPPSSQRQGNSPKKIDRSAI